MTTRIAVGRVVYWLPESPLRNPKITAPGTRHMIATLRSFGAAVEGSPQLDLLALDPKEVTRWLRAAGYVHFTDFCADVEAFRRFTECFSTDFRAYVGGAYSREAIRGDKTLLSVTGHKLRFAVPLHGEMYYLAERPQLLWFYCATPARSGGETTVADGTRFWQELSEPTRVLFRERRLKYLRTYPDGVWQGIYQTDDLDEVAALCAANRMALRIGRARAVTTEFVTPAIVRSADGQHDLFINNILPVAAQERGGSQASLVRLEDDSLIPEEVLTELRVTADRITENVAWKSGNLLLIDNARCLHGRRSFDDDQRDIYVRLGNAALPG